MSLYDERSISAAFLFILSSCLIISMYLRSILIYNGANTFTSNVMVDGGVRSGHQREASYLNKELTPINKNPQNIVSNIELDLGIKQQLMH